MLCIYICVYIYIYTHTYISIIVYIITSHPGGVIRKHLAAEKWGEHKWCRCNQVINFDILGKKGTPRHFWEYESRSTGVPKQSLC